MQKKLEAFQRLLEIISTLREKCPWDREQTIESLRSLTLEETYELSDAILADDYNEIKKELGDIIMHIVFYAKIASEQSAFDITDVLNSVCDKLIYRHPHVYGNVGVEGATEVSENWEKLKLKEKGGNRSVLAGVPQSLPSLIKAHRIQDKARGVGFDWDEKEQVWDKVKEELAEFEENLRNNSDFSEKEAEFGDLLFSLVNASRLYGINPDTALERTNQKFIQRFSYLESKTIAQGKDLKAMPLAEMDKLWEEAKQQMKTDE
ncbi:XTP/dITP diphosphohydrolase [Balneicella halophila]|uniref:Nucleoside triphosphate pyrophosphohydrolase n=1 Tax=Balneicella halophila TaxID=1537566 RepID=A0A7L4URC6_BALHA|nr:nucleoside triphosphate pyrophosphohydrolase [Balneicella halophila]PVX52303.1 XTP/dITP diphosphohydrolase [Balneicella halophila]